MKNILITLLSLFVFINIYSQCDNRVSTDPYSPSNDALPDIIGGSSPYTQDTRFLNGLDWWSPLEYTLDNMMFNPTQPYDIMNNVHPVISGYYSYLNKSAPHNNEEMNPQNGWELLLVNLGRYPDNVTIHNQSYRRRVPFIVLYHRYKGIVRVFVQYGYEQAPLLSVKGVKVDLYYDFVPNVNNASGLLRLGGGKDRTLDKETIVTKQTAIAPKTSTTDDWMSVDFQVTYDPCVCSYPTIVNLDFEFFTEIRFGLVGRSITTTEPLIDDNGNINHLDFLSGVNYSNSSSNPNTQREGFIIYRNIEKLVDDYIAKLEKYKQELDAANKHNKNVELNLAIIKTLKIVLAIGVTAATGSPEWQFINSKNPKIAFFDENDEDKIKAFNKEVNKILGKELETFIKKNFQKKALPTKPDMPTASFTEMNFRGLLEQNTLIPGPLFNTPGSFANYGTSQYNPPNGDYVVNYPVYNQPLGVFALLESPKITFAGPKKEHYVCTPDNNSFWQYSNVYSQYQFKITEDLKYTINNALDVESQEIDVSIFVKGHFIDLDKSSVYITGTPPTTYPNHDSIYYSNEYSTNITSDSYYEETNGFHKDTVTFQSEFVPIDALNNTIFGIGTRTQRRRTNCQPDWDGGKFVIDEVLLKLLVTVTFESVNSDGEKHVYDYIFTYKVEDDDITLVEQLLVSDLPNNPQLNFGQYAKSFNLESTHFDGSTIPNCKLTGNQYLCKAWEDVEIEGNLTVANNYTVKIEAGNEILVKPETIISPEIELNIASVFDLSNPTPPVDRSYVFDFCNNTDPNYPGYKANQVPKIYWNNVEDAIEVKDEALESFFTINVYPNPAKDQFNVSFDAIGTGDMHLSIIDFSGRVVSNHLIPVRREGIHNEEFDINHLAKGIYFCNFRFNNQTFNIKLVKL